MHHYLIKCSKRAGFTDIGRLRRAFERVAPGWADTVGAVDVSADGGSFRIEMDLTDEARDAVRDCELLFTLAWYDAFGTRGATHIGRPIQGPPWAMPLHGVA